MALSLFFSFRKLGSDPKNNENHLDALLRPVLLVALVKLGHDKTINEGVRRFGIFVHDRNTSLLPPNTRKVPAFIFTLHDTLVFYLPHLYVLHCSTGCIPRCNAECYYFIQICL